MGTLFESHLQNERADLCRDLKDARATIDQQRSDLAQLQWLASLYSSSLSDALALVEGCRDPLAMTPDDVTQKIADLRRKAGLDTKEDADMAEQYTPAQVSEVLPFNTIPDGTYTGDWAGHVVTFATTDGRVWVLTMRTGVRGVPSPCRVIASGGEISVSLIEEDGGNS